MKIGIYKGPSETLLGKTASLRGSDYEYSILAQFDEMPLFFKGVDVSHNWHEFKADDFDIIESDFKDEDIQ